MDIVLVLSFLGVIAGLGGLWWSSDRSIELSIELSKLFGITTFFIGFVFMAMATGLPELAIAFSSLWNQVPTMAAGDIIGSNLIDISLVLGAPAVFLGTMNVKTEEKLPLLMMLIATSFVMALVFILGVIKPIHGVGLMLLYVVSIWWLWKTKATKVVPQEEAIEELSGDEKTRRRRAWGIKLWVAAKLLFCLLVVLLSSKLSIDCALKIARHFKLNLYAIGATIFAIGTSLPELALSFQAVRRKEYALAFGNAFGSVLEQATLILGFLVIGAGKEVDIRGLRPAAPLMFLAYAVVAHAVLKKTGVGRQEGLSRKEGIVLLSLFAIHLFYFLYAA